jgi:hypothetical protein
MCAAGSLTPRCRGCQSGGVGIGASDRRGLIVDTRQRNAPPKRGVGRGLGAARPARCRLWITGINYYYVWKPTNHISLQGLLFNITDQGTACRRRWLRDGLRSRLYHQGGPPCRSLNVSNRQKSRLENGAVRIAACRCFLRRLNRPNKTVTTSALLNAPSALMRK